MFNVGDQVRISSLSGDYLPKDLLGKGGRVTVIASTPNGLKQWCRVQFSESMFDYEDLGSWVLELDQSSLCT